MADLGGTIAVQNFPLHEVLESCDITSGGAPVWMHQPLRLSTAVMFSRRMFIVANLGVPDLLTFVPEVGSYGS